MEATREYWRWWITDEVTGRRRKTSWHMTAETAAGYPDAERVEGSLELRPVAPAGDANGPHALQSGRQGE